MSFSLTRGFYTWFFLDNDHAFIYSILTTKKERHRSSVSVSPVGDERMKREGGENPPHSGRCCDPETLYQGIIHRAMFLPFLGASTRRKSGL
jgi:hypothetical protein